MPACDFVHLHNHSQFSLLDGALKIEEMVDRIETEIQRQAPGEVTSREIGERVMDELHGLDEVAYVRFASVYRHFKDVNQFLDEIQGLVQGDPDPSRSRE